MSAREWQFDGLVGPTHNYAGLAVGNLAAASNAGQVSNPRQAALQGLDKMWYVHNLGMKQAFFPPQYRPQLSALQQLGFEGTRSQILSGAFERAPWALAAVYSSSFMWAANAATIAPSPDTGDATMHLTPANLISHFHRAMEPAWNYKMLTNIFRNAKLFNIHNQIFPAPELGDEGAANHMRICLKNFEVGTHIFVYGNSHDKTLQASKYPARQKLQSFQAIARLHQLDAAKCVFLQQSPQVVDQGVFHNDVIAMNTTSRMIVHAEAFIPEHQVRLREICELSGYVKYREVTSRELSVQDAVATYLFNSQLLELPDGTFALVAPTECRDHAASHRVVEALMDESVLDSVHYLDVRESMRNGGGPACLRLRIVMNPEQESAIHPGVILTPERYAQLKAWVGTHYRDRLTFDDLRDPAFVDELNVAYLALESILGIPGLYDDARVA